MKIILPLCAFLLAAVCDPSVAFSTTSPSFVTEAPDAGARILIESYLALLASSNFEQAIPMNDLRSMREYFLTRRLSELEEKNPELTAQDLQDMSAQIQMNDLNPLRLKDILLNVMKEGEFEGMTWDIQGYARAPEAIGGYLVNVQALTANGQEKPLMLGIKKLGDQWMMAPDIIEKLAGQKSAALPAPQQVTPPEVNAVVEQFWTYWKQGKLNEVHSLFGAEFRERTPLLPFLQEAQQVIENIGIPISWSVVQCRAIGPSVLGLGVDVQGSETKMKTLMVFRKVGDTWILEDSQFRPVPVKNKPAMPATGPSPRFRSNLRPDLKSPYLPPSASASPPLPSASAEGGQDSPSLE